MSNADYSRIAATYDSGRPLSEPNLRTWLDLIAQRAGLSRGASVLDLGCGTGRFALPMAQRLGYTVTGIDSSEQMLAKARAKDVDGRITWRQADAGSLGLADGSLDAVFMSHLLHHVASPPDVLQECRRALRPGGVLLVRYGAVEQIRSDAVHAFFPDALRLDEARTPSVATTEGWLRSAGFADVASEEVVQQTYATAGQHMDAIRARATSVLTLLSDTAFGEGLARLERHARANPRDPRLLFDRMTLSRGHAPGIGDGAFVHKDPHDLAGSQAAS